VRAKASGEFSMMVRYLSSLSLSIDPMANLSLMSVKKARNALRDDISTSVMRTCMGNSLPSLRRPKVVTSSRRLR